MEFFLFLFLNGLNIDWKVYKPVIFVFNHFTTHYTLCWLNKNNEFDKFEWEGSSIVPKIVWENCYVMFALNGV